MQTVGVDPAFWSGRRVFVTGHTGFMGGWLCLWLTRLGAEVAGYSLSPPTRPSLFEAAGIADGMCSMIADIRDGERLSAALREFAPDVVLHLAAQPLVGQARNAPVETYATNVMGTVNLLNAIRSVPSISAAVIATTDKVYDNREWPWGYRETDRLGGKEPYASSKACTELVTDAFRHSYFSRDGEGMRRLGIATVRAGNIIGGGDWAANRLVPDAVRAFAAGKPLLLRYPKAVRPWQHVLDPLRGYLILAERLSFDADGWEGAWNFGPADDDAHTVSTVAGEMARQWGNGATWVPEPHDGDVPYEAGLLTLNSAKARKMLGWAPLWRLERALAATVEWYKAHLAERDMAELCHRQIAAIQGAN